MTSEHTSVSPLGEGENCRSCMSPTQETRTMGRERITAQEIKSIEHTMNMKD
jgi:hypothetical protein